jgi:membrane fusion protein (multidrug efflux system)
MRYQDLASGGRGTVRNPQQFTSQLRPQEASVQTALEGLYLAQRQVEALKAQHASAGAALAQTKAQLGQTRWTSDALVSFLRSTVMW